MMGNISEEDRVFYANLRAYHLYYEVFLASISFLLNLWVLYLVLTTKNRVMRSFCLVVLVSMAGDFIYTCFNFITMMTIEVKAGRMFFLTMGPFEHSSYPFNIIMPSMWLMAMYATILTLGMQFVYRYYALCKTPLTPLQFSIMYLIGLFFCFCDGFVSFFVFEGVSDEATRQIQEHPMYEKDTPAYMMVDPTKPGPLMHTMASQVIVIGVYVVIFYTAKKINAKLNEASSDMSVSTKLAQRQLNRAMILQASYPGIIVGLPIIVATILSQFRFDVLWCGLYLVPSISLIPIANSVTILFVIPTFRRRILSFGGARVGYVSSNVSKPFTVEPTKAGHVDTVSDADKTFEHVL